jgi:glucan phosphoethanolaminetransferase (alkaline phosphatase superfamily)
MKKEGKFLALSFLGLFLIISGLYFVTAADTTISKITDLLSGTSFTDFKGFIANLLTPHILLGILVFLVIFAIISKIKLFGSTGIKVAISVVIGILAGGFIDVNFVNAIINQYEALGILISFGVPFALIFYFLKEVAPQNKLIQKTVWIVYGIILLITYITNASAIQGTTEKGIYALCGIGAIFMVIFGGRIYNRLFINELEEAVAKNQEVNEVIIAAKISEIDELERQLDASSRAYADLEGQKYKLQGILTKAKKKKG